MGIHAVLIDIDQNPAPVLENAAGLVIVSDPWNADTPSAAANFLLSAFELARVNAHTLSSALETTGGFFTTVSFLGGTFGFNMKTAPACPEYGGLAGLSKTAALEWPEVLCHALDMPVDPDAAKAHGEAAVALMMTHGAVEMGIQGDQCLIPTLVPSAIPRMTDKNANLIDLGAKDVVVITGGAKGVTAECALALAKTCNPTIVLMGRSPAPFEEPNWLTGVTEPGEMKKAILTHGFPDDTPKPVEVETQYRRFVSNRSILETIRRIEAHAPQVKYLSLDIRNREQVADALKEVTHTLGSITAVIHGAGVLEDKLIAEKSGQQFQRVFNTKVQGLETILDAIDMTQLKYLVLFSSIAGRLGNRGQCDYAAANEVLNKKAQTMALSHPGCRVLSLNWGPWDGGMVTSGLKKEFSRRGVELIPLSAGAAQLVNEMANPDRNVVEVVIGATMNPSPTNKTPRMNKAMSLSIGPTATPIVNSHKIDNTPVVPFALMADLMGGAGTKNNPGLQFIGIDNMRLLKGITLEREDIAIQVNTGKCQRRDGLLFAPAELVSQTGSLKHAQAQVVLSDTLPEPPVLSQAAFMDLTPCALTPQTAYETVLFHKGSLQSIVEIKGISPKGIEVIALPGRHLEEWYTMPASETWAVDPLMLDTAFQTAILWLHETRGQVCLPAFFANLRIYRSYAARSGNIRVLFTVNNETRHTIQGYFTFLDDTDTVIASMMGFEGVIDSALKEKFHPEPLFNRDKILAFAQGNPSEAFGEAYKIFDSERQIARLPRPPYFFMDTVNTVDHTPWEMAPGGWIETEYTIPESAWYFAANRSQAMPFCILLEIALQPCGWLAAYAGSALHSDNRLHFRNLGGDAVLHTSPTRTSGRLTVRVKMTDVSKAGGMIIQDFKLQVLNHGTLVYEGTTNFGFFTAEALANQVGIREPRFYQALNLDQPPIVFEDTAPLTPDDPHQSSDTGMPAKAIRMIDRIDHMDPEGGLYSQGIVQASKDVIPEDWFFDAHFYQDPVCPGSLGVESFIQMLRFFLVTRYTIDPEKYVPEMTENIEHKWCYRGQIIPSNKKVTLSVPDLLPKKRMPKNLNPLLAKLPGTDKPTGNKNMLFW